MPFDSDGLTDTQRVLLKAAARVRQGWCQGLRWDGGFGVCLLGAVATAKSGSPHNNIDDYLYCLLRAHLGESPVCFNDAPGRTAEEVAQALESCAMGMR